MIRLMPYSVYEFSAMDRFFSKMAQRNWQYHWRFLCFIGFRRSSDAEALKCAPCNAKKANGWIHFYRDNKIADDVRLVGKNDNASVLMQGDELYAPLKNETVVQFITNALLLLAACFFTAFVCAWANWDSMNSLWGMREVSSLIILPCTLFLAVNQLFLTVRLVKIYRFTRKRNSYLPWNNIVRYAFFFLAIVLMLVQLVAGANAYAQTEESNLYKECCLTFRDTFENVPANYNGSLTATRYVLDPLSWEAFFHIGEGNVRITYHDCLSNAGAKNYFAQFQKDNIGTQQVASLDRTAEIRSAVSDDYYSIACIHLNRILVVTFRNLSVNEASLAANKIVDVFLGTGG